MLIVARALLGLAGATLAPSTMSLIFTMFRDPQQRTVAIGVWIASYSAGAAVGPLLGGVMLEFFWWGSVFLLGVPVMALLLARRPAAAARVARRGRRAARPAQRGALARRGAARRLRAQDARRRTGSRARRSPPSRWAPSVALVFVRRQLRLPNPLIDLRAVPPPRVQRLAADQHARLLRRVRRVLLRRPVPADRRRAVAARGRAVVAALVGGLRRRRDARARAAQGGSAPAT